ncbi:DNA polymerase III subunit delta' [Devosia yakushimensis]|uniref:DNA polymerase III subunit delta n=1 Tax=Devosia yakushimensis TaxID=470028 RepID=A0ABQ5UKQ2_9HYPH|nr:heme-binding protein [Devosia yakushimensis]GLQ11922.1 DNA polymerase III subunit delta' [Devosia yakushimensis]
MLTINRLSLSDAGPLLEGARARAEAIGVPMCIAVTDESGNLIAFERMDGGKITSITIAIDKAFTAAAARKPTHEYGEAAQPGSAAYGINSAIAGRLLVVAGGLPIVVDGVVVGGIGISSGTPGQDREVAEAAIAAFGSGQ